MRAGSRCGKCMYIILLALLAGCVPAIGQGADTAEVNPFQQLIFQLGSADMEERHEARDQLLSLGAEAVPALVLAVASDSVSLRWEAVNLLGELGDVRAMEALLRSATTDASVHVRWRANWAITCIDGASAVTRLIEALCGENPTFAWNAAITLSLLDRIEAVPVLHQGLCAGGWRQWEAVNALGRVWNHETASLLVVLLREGAEDIRAEAALSLGNIGGKLALDALLVALRDDGSFQVRWRAAMMIGLAGRPADVPVLEEALSCETHPLVIEHVRKAIDSLSGAG